ncbi:YslB family protein [Heyndrickxia vini]|uniref:YslB family protein n=1 Tax=Heyndrickxia vini TaxID=1476025 RepID=A0ABX7E5V0_9BACI|nr:YslB family protein [Heyndrickxia vini]QQZ10669.1 YslB family protein [Heyndrickxia vini]
MKSSAELEVNTENSELSIPAFGYELIRDILLPEILGKETPDILYWSGKLLARKFPLMSLNEIISFFDEAGWGDLRIIKEEKKGMELELTSPLISRQFELKTESSFKLEAGFLAEQIQSQRKVRTEAYEEIVKRHKKIKIIVQWDLKDTDI